MCDGEHKGEGLGEVETVVRAVEALLERRRPERSSFAQGEELIKLRHAADLLELAFAREAAVFAATDEYDQQGFISPMQWIRQTCRMTGRAAAAAITVGEQEPALPGSSDALRSGSLGFAHQSLLAETAAALQESPTARPFDEAPLLRKALTHSLSRFRRECAHMRHAADAQRYLANQLDAEGYRRVELLPCEDGAVVLRGFLDPVGGATLRTALEPLARRNGSDDTRSREQRWADALVELAGHGGRAQLQVTASLETLLGSEGAPAGELEFCAPIAAATVQRLACDASVTRVVLGPDSAVLDVGRTRRVPSAATRRALRARDAGCVWPGCERPSSWTAPHHIRHWANGGDTTLENLASLCHRHHWKVHEGGWQLARKQHEVVAVPPVPEFSPSARSPNETA
jgi:Domain of unknown function (DUF222)/HNH endonuclease